MTKITKVGLSDLLRSLRRADKGKQTEQTPEALADWVLKEARIRNLKTQNSRARC